MERSQRSRTVELPAIMRALHQTIDDDPKILGFSHTIHLTAEQARELYFGNRRDGLKERRGEQLMRAIV